MRILIGCEYSGRTREAFRARGHEAVSCDLLPSEDNSPHHIIGDVFDVIRDYGPFDLMVAHPPCTYLANSGARWLYTTENGLPVIDQRRWESMEAGAKFFADLMLAPIPKIACENPIMHVHARNEIERHLGHPMGTHFVQPWWYGDKAFKATGFTLKGLPPLVKPSTALVPPRPGTPEYKAWSVIYNQPPGPDRWKERSRTFPGIARAMAETWG